MADTARNERWEREDHSPPRQVNFLQKLYHFLSLDPHPCPDVIYWADDSRQLVIAQSERLAEEVLPVLYKHNKLPSFIRQLNIYGFNRLYPGRQFKDANGLVSNASVWQHPTLHRLSTPEEIAEIKRHAAPKLYRTKVLPNGEVIKTKAGPAVEAKAKKIKEDMAEAKRLRVALVRDSFHARSPSQPDYPLHPNNHVSPSFPHASLLQTVGRLSLSLLNTPGRLSNISEDGVSHDMPTPYSPPDSMQMDIDRRASLASMVSEQMPFLPWTDASPAHTSANAGVDPGDTPLAMIQYAFPRPPSGASPSQLRPARYLHSCPASIHTSPVPTHTVVQGDLGLLQNPVTYSPDPPRFAPVRQPELDTSFHPTITAPAATPPLTAQDLSLLSPTYTSAAQQSPSWPTSPSSGFGTMAPAMFHTPVSQMPTPLLDHTDPSAQTSVSSMSSCHPSRSVAQPSWESALSMHSPPMYPKEVDMMAAVPGTIDPKWVGPDYRSFNSLIQTPVMTPAPQLGDVSVADSTLPVFNQLQTLANGDTMLSQPADQGLIPNQLQTPDLSTLQGTPPIYPQMPLRGTLTFPLREAERRQMESGPSALHLRWP